MKQINDVKEGLSKNGLSIESLRNEYRISHGSYVLDLYSDNHFLLCSDDSGTPCLTMKEYQTVLDEIKSLVSLSNFIFLEEYIENRSKLYFSPRRGECRALRGVSYYRMVEELNNDILFKRLKDDLRMDSKLYNYIAHQHCKFPKELYFLVIEHVKNSLFRVMYAYIEKSIKEKDFFNREEWFVLDSIAKILWEMHIRVVLDDYFLQTQISFTKMFEIIGKLHDQDFGRVRELDSAKTLLRISRIFYSKNQEFDFCLPMYYGGIEMAYAFHAYCLFKNRKGFKEIVPIIFSSNRLKKGIVRSSVMDENGLIKEENLNEVMPEYFVKKLQKSKEFSILLVDNNITTGGSIKIVTESFRKYGFTCEMLVAEVNIQEIKEICEGAVACAGKDVLVRGSELFCSPTGEYVTCFGINNNSRVINRIKLILGNGRYTQIEGYDFDDTLFKTSKVHRESWNKALSDLGIEFDVINLPNNSGLTFKQASENIFNHLAERGIEILGEKEVFMDELCKKKLNNLLDFPVKDIPAIARTINIVKADVSNTKVVITNNSLSFVFKCLVEKELIGYFDYLICNDYAYCTNTEEKVVLLGRKKPAIGAYIEASTYFELPKIQTYYGDDTSVDRQFAHKLKCNFVLI